VANGNVTKNVQLIHGCDLQLIISQLEYFARATSMYQLVGTDSQYSDTSQISIGYHILTGKIWDVVVRIRLCDGLDDKVIVVQFLAGARIFLFSEAFRPAAGYAQACN
jgi:hypothetical protein